MSENIHTNPTQTDFGGWIRDIADVRAWRNVRFQRAVNTTKKFRILRLAEFY